MEPTASLTVLKKRFRRIESVSLTVPLQRMVDVLAGGTEVEDAMRVVELDGFVAGIVVCPEAIPPPEWMAELRGEQQMNDSEAMLAELTDYCDRVTRQLTDDPESYAPIFQLDEQSGDVRWVAWIKGFDRAMGLRGEAREEIVRSDGREAATAIFLLTALTELVGGMSGMSMRDVQKLNQRVPILIARFVRDLHAWTPHVTRAAMRMVVPGQPRERCLALQRRVRIGRVNSNAVLADPVVCTGVAAVRIERVSNLERGSEAVFDVKSRSPVPASRTTRSIDAQPDAVYYRALRS